MAVDLATFSPKRILVCQLRQIGDVVLATPSIELLKRRYPDAEIHLLTEKKCAPLLEHNPHLGKVWALDKKVLSSLPQEIAWYWHVARTGYDLVVDFQQLPRCRWVVAFSGAPVRLSYTPPWYTRLLYTHSSDMLDGYSEQIVAAVPGIDPAKSLVGQKISVLEHDGRVSDEVIARLEQARARR